MFLSDQTFIFIFFAGLLQAWLLSLVIYFYPSSDRSVNIYLSAYIIAFTLPIITPILLQYTTWHNAVAFRSVLLLSNPALYFYVLSFRQKITWRLAWLHFIPFVIQLSLDLQLYFSTIDVVPRANVPPPGIEANPFTVSLFIMRVGQIVFYYVACFKALKQYQRTIHQIFSETSRINLSWLRWLINGNAGLAIIMAAFYPVVLKYPDQFKFMVLFNVSLLTPYIYIATFKGLTQPTLWQIKPGLSHENVEEEIREVELVAEAADKKKNLVSDNKIAEIVIRATELMENEKIFRTTDLTLQELSDRIAMPAYQVSQAINEGLNKNFYDLVNGYRVEEAKRLLLDPKTSNHKIISLAQDAGFNSKTTFNTVFKKFTGYSPTEFRESRRTQPVQQV